jgi:hypothetical protein
MAKDVPMKGIQGAPRQSPGVFKVSFNWPQIEPQTGLSNISQRLGNLTQPPTIIRSESTA